MATKKELQRLKRPDYFQTKGINYLNWLQERRSLVISLLVVIACVIGGVFIAYEYQEDQTEKRISEVYEIDEQFNDEELVVSQQRESIFQEIESLEANKKTLEEKDKKTSEDEKSIKELAASIEQSIAKLKEIKPDHKYSLEKYLAFYRNNISYPEGWRAGIIVSKNYIDNKDFAKAKEILSEVLQTASQNIFYQIQVRSMYIAVLEELSDYKEALAQVDIMDKSASDDLKPRILLLKARIFSQDGNKAEAIKVVDQILLEYKSSQEFPKARAFKALLKG